MAMPDPISRFRLDGRNALVTGGRREIGRAIALGLAAQGARVVVHHTGSADESRDAETVVRDIEAGGGQAVAIGADFSVEGDAARLADRARDAFGLIDILVLNASIEIHEAWTDISDATFDRQVNVNLRATLILLQALAPAMAARGWGRIVTIGSVQQNTPSPVMLVYAGAKAMQHNWAINLARQLGPSGVTVNNLAPGLIRTARNVDQLAADGERMIARIPLGRAGRPDDLVGAALLLCSDAGSYINGANFFVDGGRHIGM